MPKYRSLTPSMTNNGARTRLKTENMAKVFDYMSTLKEPFTREEVANHVGLKTSTVGTYFNDFIKDGVLELIPIPKTISIQNKYINKAKEITTAPSALLSRKWV